MVTETVCIVDVPPTPEHISEYTALLKGVTTAVPPMPFDPLQSPDAVQSVAFVEDQVSVDDCPLIRVSADALSDAVGIGGCMYLVALHCAVVPPLLPPHDQVYVLVFVLTLDAVPVVQRF
jgi:hypothetical protein